MRLHFSANIGIALFGLLVCHALFAADAGQVQRDINKLNNPNTAPATQPENYTPVPAETQPNVSVKVTAFKIVGAESFTEAQLQSRLQSYLGKTLSFSALNQATQVLSALYRENGRLARVFLPPQDIENGVVTIEVVEAKLGKISATKAPASHLHLDRALRMVTRTQATGQKLDIAALERSLLLINDLPGYRAESVLSSGAQLGETDVSLNLSDRSPVNASVWLDN